MSQVPLSQRCVSDLPLLGVKVYMQVRPKPDQRTPGGCSLTVIIPEGCNEMLLDRELGESATMDTSSSSSAAASSSSNSAKRAALQGSDRIIMLNDGSMMVNGDRVKHNAKKDIHKLGAQLILSENEADVIVFYNGSNSLLENIIAEDKIPVVSPAWLIACKKARAGVPTDEYELSIANSPRVPTNPKAHFDLPKHSSQTTLKPTSSSSSSTTSTTTTTTSSMQPPSSSARRLMDDEDDDEDSIRQTHKADDDYKLALKFALQESQSQLLYGNSEDDNDNESTDEMSDDYEDGDDEDSDDEGGTSRRTTSKKKGHNLTISAGGKKKKTSSSKIEKVVPKKTVREQPKVNCSLLLPDSPLSKMMLVGAKPKTSSSSKSITFSSISDEKQKASSHPPSTTTCLLTAPFLNPEEDSQPQVVAQISQQVKVRGDATTVANTNHSPSNNSLVNKILLATKHRHSLIPTTASPTTSSTGIFQQQHHSNNNMSSVPTTQKLERSEPYLAASSSSSSTLQPTPTPVSSQHLRTDILFSKAILEAQQRQMENTARLEREEAEEKFALSAGKRGSGGKRSSKSVTPTTQGAAEYSDIKSEGSTYNDGEGIAPKRLFSMTEDDPNKSSHHLHLGSKRPRSESPSSRKKEISDNIPLLPPQKPTAPIPVTFACPAPGLCSISGLGDTRATVQSIMDFMGCGITSKVYGKRTVVKPTHMILVSGAVEDDDADGPGSPSVIHKDNKSLQDGEEDVSPGNSNSTSILGNTTTHRAYLQIASILPKTYKRYVSTVVVPSSPTSSPPPFPLSATSNPLRIVTQGEPNDFMYPQPWNQLLATATTTTSSTTSSTTSICDAQLSAALQHIVQFLASLSSSSVESSGQLLPPVVRKVPSFMDNLVSSRVLLALATGIPLLSHKWVFACMEIAPQAQPYTPTTTTPTSKKVGRKPKVALVKSEVEVPKYALHGNDVNNVESHGKLYDGTIFCDDWSCSCCSDATDSDDSVVIDVESDDGDEDDDDRKAAAIAARNLSRRPLRRDSVKKGTFLSYYGYPPATAAVPAPNPPSSSKSSPRSKKCATTSDNENNCVFSVKVIDALFKSLKELSSLSSTPSHNGVQLSRDIFTKYALVGLLPAEHSTYVSPFQIPVTDIITVLCDHNNEVRREMAATYFGVKDRTSAATTGPTTTTIASPDATLFVSSGLRIQELWDSMCLSFPSWNMKHQLETLPAYYTASFCHVKQNDESSVNGVVGRASVILTRGYQLLSNHTFLSESAYSSVRCTYLKSLFRGMTFLLLGQHSAPKNSDLIELIEIMGGSTTKDVLAGHITAVIEMDRDNSLNELVALFRKQHEKRSSGGGGSGSVTKTRSPVNASPPPMAPASDEERQKAFQHTYPHARLCLSLQWIFDCILHQRLMATNKDNTSYVKIHLPPPTPSPMYADDSEDEENDVDAILLGSSGGDELPHDHSEYSTTNLRTPLTNTTTTDVVFASSPQGVGAAENDLSESDVSPARSSAGGGGRLSSGSRKKRRGPQSAVKDPDLQLSTQQLLLPSQASLHTMLPQFDEDE